MSISNKLMYAVLAMDSYNQGYGRGIEHNSLKIGSATGIDEKGDSEAISASFYASAYSYKDETVASFRGTDSELELLATDFPLAGSNDFDEPQVHLVSQWLGDGKQYIYIANQNCSAEPQLRLAS